MTPSIIQTWAKNLAIHQKNFWLLMKINYMSYKKNSQKIAF